MIVMTSMIELEILFDPMFDEYFNGENQVVSKSFVVTTADASDKSQQQSDLISSTSTLATTVTADGNFDFFGITTNPNGDQPCEEECSYFMWPRISNITADDNIFNGGSIQEDTPIYKESIERRKMPSADVRVSNITVFFFETTDDNLFNGGSIQEDTPISKESIERRETPSVDVQILGIGGHDMVPTTTVHVSRIFDRFRNMRLNNLGSDYMSHAAPITDKVSVPNVHKRGCLHTVSTTSSLEESIHRNTICTQDILGHTASSSRKAPVNHAYLCMDVTNYIIRPEIITFPNSSAKNVYQSHARGDYSDTTYCIILHNEVSAISECSTLGTQKTSQSRPLQTVMYNQPSSSRNVPRRPQNQGDTTSYIDLGDYDQECCHCGCLFWYNERLKGNDYGERVEYHLCCGGGKIYMPPTPDPPVFIQKLLRNSHFMEHDEDILNPEIVEGLIHVLDEHNGLVRLFRTAHDRCSAGGRLFQQYVVAGFCVIEQSRLDWVRNHQNDLRSDYMLGLYDAVSRGDREGIQAGLKIMLPRTFTEGPRYMYNHYLDALAIFLYTIEFQKRGLPYCHTLLWVNSSSKIRDAVEIDKYIFSEIPDPVEDPRGYKVVTELMMHRPCGVANPGASCTENGACNKYFPKRYNKNIFFDINGHTRYRRRQTEVHIMKGESRLDNCNVVPYNRMLCLAFHVHINVKYCGWSMLIKYLFKYISKGLDRILAKINRPIGDTFTSMVEKHIQVDEIQNYVDSQFICPFKAYWRIFDFPIHNREPVVPILNDHLENKQRVTFRKRDWLDIIVNMHGKKKTTLTEWYVYNNENTDDRHLTYLDFPSKFVWYPNSKSWRRRVVRTKKSLGRLTYVHLNSGDLFYFRMLLAACEALGVSYFKYLIVIECNTGFDVTYSYGVYIFSSVLAFSEVVVEISDHYQ
ncbi:DNA helicase [Tanacetum coccineum]